MRVYFLIFLSISLLPLICSWPQGSGVCFSDSNSLQQSLSSQMNAEDGSQLDFFISGPSALKKGENEILFDSQSGSPFTGFLIYAENSSGQRIGEWIPISGTQNNAINPLQPCPTETGQLTHSTAKIKQTPYSMKFVLPDNTNGNLVFKALMVGSENKEMKLLKPLKIAIANDPMTSTSNDSSLETNSDPISPSHPKLTSESTASFVPADLQFPSSTGFVAAPFAISTASHVYGSSSVQSTVSTSAPLSTTARAQSLQKSNAGNGGMSAGIVIALIVAWAI